MRGMLPRYQLAGEYSAYAAISRATRVVGRPPCRRPLPTRSTIRPADVAVLLPELLEARHH